MRRILLCPSAFYPSLGGVEEICRNLAAKLQEKGFTVAIAVNRFPDALPETEEMEGVPVHRFFFKSPGRTLTGLAMGARIPGNIARFLKFVQSFEPDVIHVICPSSNSLYCYVARMLLKKKLLVTLQGEFFMDANNFYDRSAFARYSASKLLNAADGVTACSKYVLDDAKQRFPFNSPIEEVLFNGVDLSEQLQSQDDLILPNKFIFGLGRLVHNKGFDWLIKAFKRLSSLQPNVDLVLAGAGEAQAELNQLCLTLAIEKRVHFVGRQARPAVTDLFRKCLFFVLPSPVEPFGIVCLEAMRAGKAVIATNTGGPPEFIQEGVNGLLVPPKDDEALFHAMSRLCSDEKLIKELGKNGLEQVQNFDWKQITDQYIKLYSRLTSG
jgi:glycosyltransferase involved in cell wall biosynthesis